MEANCLLLQEALLSREKLHYGGSENAGYSSLIRGVATLPRIACVYRASPMRSLKFAVLYDDEGTEQASGTVGRVPSRI
jgi:hypothetical protein